MFRIGIVPRDRAIGLDKILEVFPRDVDILSAAINGFVEIGKSGDVLTRNRNQKGKQGEITMPRLPKHFKVISEGFDKQAGTFSVQVRVDVRKLVEDYLVVNVSEMGGSKITVGELIAALKKARAKAENEKTLDKED